MKSRHVDKDRSLPLLVRSFAGLCRPPQRKLFLTRPSWTLDSVYCLDTCTPCGIGLYSWILFVHQREADHLTTSMIALDPQKKQQVSLIWLLIWSTKHGQRTMIAEGWFGRIPSINQNRTTWLPLRPHLTHTRASIWPRFNHTSVWLWLPWPRAEVVMIWWTRWWECWRGWWLWCSGEMMRRC